MPANIVITGASRGIGYETAKLLVSKGNRVVAISRNMDGLNTLRAECDKANSEGLMSIQYDLQTDNYKESLLPEILKHIDRVDILINNAGLLINKKFQDIEPLETSAMFNVNIFGAIKLSQLLLPYMGGDHKSHIVNIGSMGGFQGSKKFPGLAAYSASKGALAILSECMAEELKELNISVNCLALGAVNSEMLQQVFPGFTAPTDADKMAKYIVHFCENDAAFLNGKIIPVSLS